MKKYSQQQQQQQHQKIWPESKSSTAWKTTSDKQHDGGNESTSFGAEKSDDGLGSLGRLRTGLFLSSPLSTFSFLVPCFDSSLEKEDFAVPKPPAVEVGSAALHYDGAYFARQYIHFVLEDRRTRALSPSCDTLSSKVQTVAFVRDRLHVGGVAITPSLVFAVSLLAYGCALESEWEEAQGHVEALNHLIDSCGGIQEMDFELQRTVTWITYCVAGARGTNPTFTPPLFLESGALSMSFCEDARMKAWRTVKRFHNSPAFVYDVAVRLHRLALATSTEWCERIDQQTLSNLHFEAMSQALLVSVEEPWTMEFPKSTWGQEMSTIFRVWAAGLPLFVWAIVRQARSRLGLTVPWSGHHFIFSRIHQALKSGGGIAAWMHSRSLEPVLASLFYCVESCDSADPWRQWSVQMLRAVAQKLDIREVEGFTKRLESFPSTEQYQLAANQIWKELETCRPLEMQQA
ncbi:hypothetical protein M3J09_010644 [Ascochyta lentis]